MDVDTISDDLTIQQVMLSSIEEETFDGVEQEREEILAEIARLKALLEEAKKPGQSHEGGSSSRQRLATPEDQHYSPAGSSLSIPDTTSHGATHDQQNASQYSLPSRKRDRDNSLHQANKSRRTTPSPHPATSFASSYDFDNLEVIDLTGDIDPDFMADQVRQEKLLEQEKADQELARLLSSQGEDAAPPPNFSQRSAPRASQAAPRVSQASPFNPNSAFDKIMETQRLNGMPSASQGRNGPSMNPVPGAWPGSWADPDDPSLDQESTLPRTPNRSPFKSESVSQSGKYQVPARHLPASTAGLRADNPIIVGESSSYSQQPVPRHPMVQGRGNTLSDIISMTSGYDYTNSLDAFGNPLPERLTSYINDMVHDTRVTEKELDDLLQNIRPDMEIPERDRVGTPEGLKGTLYHHQEIALTWLKKMEEGTNKGGILADDMGLGKTISMISLMLARPPTARPKTNLIIGPVALLRQWEEEIRDKVQPSHRMSIFVHHGNKKLSVTSDDLARYDVVLTTYMTLAAESKRLEKLKDEYELQRRQIDYGDSNIIKKFPLLHPRTKFYRIVLDEAQCIKNKNTQSAKACHKLNGVHRWCLSGTPMMNGVDELFSLLAFLRIKPYCVWEKFRQAFGTLFGKKGDPQSEAMSRLRVLLKAIMLRRKKNSTIDGRPILRLPPKTEETVHVELTKDELDFYKQLEQKSQVIFNKYLRDGSVGKNYSHILVLLLRLRQACCHPHLNLDVDDAAPTSAANVEELVRKLDPATIERIKAIEAFECPVCYDAVQSPQFFVPCGHDSCQQCLARIVDSAATNSIREGNETAGVVNARCPVCRGNFEPAKCFSLQTFQKIHMPSDVKAENKEDPDETDGGLSDSDLEDETDDEDGDDVDSKGNLKGFIVDDEDFKDDLFGPKREDEDTKDEKRKKKKKRSKGKGKGKDRASDVKPSMLKALRMEANKNHVAYKKYMAYLHKTWLPSAKVAECMKLLTAIQETGEKTIIFSQWTLLLDLVEVGMKHEGFAKKPVRYDGGMSANERNNAAHEFRTKEDVKVILVSLKAGNAGLNLADASRVIILDPFWNPYIEMQAVDRAYRIGQQREVKVYRILTQETVEDRIMELQERKKQMVEAALDEAAGKSISRLSTSELKYLFNGRR
ncbi:unnamed protein product [Clonostachys rosea]|uniref:RING-type domain-containing protein n=1 Tax=Bionectria ochroleuca TaxID=29856 RepID=A0ABY6UGV8_BIOOC|nr:unnamed protein product [Clonostachys rosea]